jgi:hypothetical protein
VWAVGGGVFSHSPHPQNGEVLDKSCHIQLPYPHSPTRLSLHVYHLQASLYIDSKKERERLKEREILLCRLIACQRHLVSPRRSALVLVPPPILAPAVWAGLKYNITRKVRTAPCDPAATSSPLAVKSLKHTYLQISSILVATVSVQTLFLLRNKMAVMRNFV